MLTRRKRNRGIIIGAVIAALAIGGLVTYFALNNKASNVNAAQAKPEAPKDTNIKISFVGDVLIHQDVLDAAKDKQTGNYDFKNNLKFIKDLIEPADYAVANLEASLAGPEKGFSGYPTFNTPDSILDAVKDAGFDMVSIANNHINDSGKNGLLRTVNTVKNSGLAYMGVRPNESEKNYTIKDIKGVKVGFANYVFQTAMMKGHKSINSIPLDPSVESLVNTFDPQNPEADYPAMQKAIDSMKADGAEFIIFSMHWGEEYQSVPNETQKDIAKKIADMGANAIIGGHPHVVQPIDVINTSDNRKVPVFYSLGNFISHQRYEVLHKEPEIGEKSWRTEESMIANLELKKDATTGKVELSNVSYVPTWVNRQEANNLYYYQVVPSGQAIKEPDKYEIKNSSFVPRMQKSYDFILNSMKSMTKDELLKHPTN